MKNKQNNKRLKAYNIAYEEEAYNLLTEDPIKTNVKIYRDAKMEQSNKVVFKKEKRYDPESANEVAIKMLNKFSSHQKEELEENLQDLRVDLQKMETLEYNYETNAPIRIELEQKNITALGIKNALKIKKTIIRKIK